MCSTPRPKRVMKTNSTSVTTNGTILSGLSAQKRAAFVQRANQADDRRYELQQKAAEKKRENNHLTHTKNLSIKKSTKNWSYWLIDASIKEIVMMLFLGKSY